MRHRHYDCSVCELRDMSVAVIIQEFRVFLTVTMSTTRTMAAATIKTPQLKRPIRPTFFVFGIEALKSIGSGTDTRYRSVTMFQLKNTQMRTGDTAA